jgi:hypothetical protein
MREGRDCMEGKRECEEMEKIDCNHGEMKNCPMMGRENYKHCYKDSSSK